MSDRYSQKVDRLNEKNYATWSVYAIANLNKKNLWEVVSGAVTCPVGSPNNKVVRAFRRRQAEACSEIVLSVEPSQLPYCRTDDPLQMWGNLLKVHRAHGLACRLALRRRFLYMRKNFDSSMQSWISQVQSAAFELGAVDAPVSDEDSILVITQGLPKSYDAVVTSLDATQPDLLTLDHVIERLLGAEAQIESRTNKGDPNNVALAAYPRRNLDHITCFGCRKKGHYERDCPNAKTAESSATTMLAITASPERGMIEF